MSAHEVHRYTAFLAEAPIDVRCLRLGRNGHLAFNDPPVADLPGPVAVKVVELDDWKRQQVEDPTALRAHNAASHRDRISAPESLVAAMSDRT